MNLVLDHGPVQQMNKELSLSHNIFASDFEKLAIFVFTLDDIGDILDGFLLQSKSLSCPVWLSEALVDESDDVEKFFGARWAIFVNSLMVLIEFDKGSLS
jgi:hypothetical protein